MAIISGSDTGITALTGDVTASGSGSVAATISNSAVTYAKIQNVSATDRLLGRSTSGAGVVEEIVCTDAGRALLDDVSASAQRDTLGVSVIEIASIMNASQFGQLMAGTSTTVMTGIGLLVGNSLSTDASRTVTTGPAGALFTQTGTATAGVNCGSSASATIGLEIDCPFIFTANVGFSSYSSIRLAIGLRAGSGILNIVDSDDAGLAWVGFQFSTDRGDTTFQVCSNTGAAQTIASTGVTPVVSTLYSFELRSDGTNVIARIYNSAGTILSTNTISATLPTATTDLCAVACFEPRTNTAISIFINSFLALNLSSRR